MPVVPLRVQKIGRYLRYWEPGLAKERMLVSASGKRPKAQVSGMRLVVALW